MWSPSLSPLSSRSVWKEAGCPPSARNDRSGLSRMNREPGVNDKQEHKEEAMTFAREMVLTHPGTLDVDTDVLSRCIDECLSCAQSCTACADACIAEETVADLRRCIYFCLNCADVCETTGRI